MRIVQVPVLSDNYSYLVIDEETNLAATVDPAEPKTVIAAAKKEQVNLSAILTTHHHWDHAGGNEEMKNLLPTLEVYGGDTRIPALTKQVTEGDTFKIGNLSVRVFFTPCHTSGHVLYLIKNEKNPNQTSALFTGDTLFIGGCGRFFEGTAQQMYHALCEVISNLPPKTEVYCGHEYTLKNLQFAKTIEPSNPSVLSKLEWANQCSQKGLSTVPSTIEEELTYNPFMRVNFPSVQSSVCSNDPIEVMSKLRTLKNDFK